MYLSSVVVIPATLNNQAKQTKRKEVAQHIRISHLIELGATASMSTANGYIAVVGIASCMETCLRCGNGGWG